MEARDVLDMPWKTVMDWSELSASAEGRYGYFVTEADVNAFVENTFRSVARRLHIPYAELFPILKNENNSFYKLKATLFYRSAYGKYHTQLKDLQRLLKIPDVNGFGDNGNNIDKCLAMYSSLSDIEKVEFLSKIGKITIKVE